MLPIEHQFSHGSPTTHPSSTPLVSPRFPRSHMVQLVNHRQIGRVANVVEGAFAASSAIGAVAKPMTTSSSTSMTPEHLSLEVWTPGAHTLEFWTGSWWWKPGSVHLRQAIVSVLGLVTPTCLPFALHLPASPIQHQNRTTTLTVKPLKIYLFKGDLTDDVRIANVWAVRFALRCTV